MKKIFLFIFFIITCTYITAKPVSEHPLRHHIIIALDKAGCDGWIGNNEVGQNIFDLLKADLNSLINPDNSVQQGSRRLYEDGDYLSIVGFRINSSQGDMNVFSMPLRDGTSKMAYCEYTQEDLKRLMGDEWNRIALQSYNPGGEAYSLVSVAKAYALGALKSEGQYVNRTFLVMVSDKHYNGNNFYDEMQAFYQKQQGVALTPQKIFSKCYEVEQNYVIKYIATKSIWAGNLYSPKGYVEFYEYMPLQKNFTVQTVINFPTHLIAKLKRDGSYSIELPLSWQGEDRYSLQYLAVFPIYVEKAIYEMPDDAVCIDSLKEEVVNFIVPPDQSAKFLEIRAWLNLIDGFYNATLMSPEKESLIEAGREGLNYLIPIEYESPETVMGIPISHLIWPPFVDDQNKAALIWRIILGLIFLAGLIVFIRWLRKPRYYTPHHINWPNASS